MLTLNALLYGPSYLSGLNQSEMLETARRRLAELQSPKEYQQAVADSEALESARKAVRSAVGHTMKEAGIHAGNLSLLELQGPVLEMAHAALRDDPVVLPENDDAAPEAA
jgi:hypothetical protein